MATPGNFREVEIWIAAEMSTGSSSEPTLIVTVSGALSVSCQSRDPQFGQKAHLRRLPLSAVRAQYSGTPRVTRRPARGTASDMPKAETDCFFHSRQWQT
jgi:hypothetical protein